jgi:hypothetical protein
MVIDLKHLGHESGAPVNTPLPRKIRLASEGGFLL